MGLKWILSLKKPQNQIFETRSSSGWVLPYVRTFRMTFQTLINKRGAPIGGHPVTFIMILWIFIIQNLKIILFNLQIAEAVCFAFLSYHTVFQNYHTDFLKYHTDFSNYRAEFWIIILFFEFFKTQWVILAFFVAGLIKN